MTALAIQDYALLSDEECALKIQTAKATLGKRCIVLGHHYQRDEVFQYADISGDSLKLSREAALQLLKALENEEKNNKIKQRPIKSEGVKRDRDW